MITETTRVATPADELQRYLDAFRAGFRRREQRVWAAIYLQGLLGASRRKNVENLARTVALPPGLAVEDVAQALGHFLNQSPWDEALLLRLHQQRLAAAPEAALGTFVLDELAFVKQGRHSVGVQRQLSRALGQKTNCQVAVVVQHVSAAGALPVALRLYLPRGWLADEERLNQAGVPAAARRATSRLELGLELLDQARRAGLQGLTLAAGPGWQASEDMAAEAAHRGLAFREALAADQLAEYEAARGRLERLGLDHFEGRSWRGFHHHACLVLLAAGCPAVP